MANYLKTNIVPLKKVLKKYGVDLSDISDSHFKNFFNHMYLTLDLDESYDTFSAFSMFQADILDVFNYAYNKIPHYNFRKLFSNYDYVAIGLYWYCRLYDSDKSLPKLRNVVLVCDLI